MNTEADRKEDERAEMLKVKSLDFHRGMEQQRLYCLLQYIWSFKIHKQSILIKNYLAFLEEYTEMSLELLMMPLHNVGFYYIKTRQYESSWAWWVWQCDSVCDTLWLIHICCCHFQFFFHSFVPLWNIDNFTPSSRKRPTKLHSHNHLKEIMLHLLKG